MTADGTSCGGLPVRARIVHATAATPFDEVVVGIIEFGLCRPVRFARSGARGRCRFVALAQRLRTLALRRGGFGVLVEDLSVDDERLGVGLRFCVRRAGDLRCRGLGFRQLVRGGCRLAFGTERRRDLHAGAFGGRDLVRPDGDPAGGHLGIGLGNGRGLLLLGPSERGDLLTRGRLGGGSSTCRHDPLRGRFARVDGAAQTQRAVVGDVARVVLLNAREPRVRFDELGVRGALARRHAEQLGVEVLVLRDHGHTAAAGLELATAAGVQRAGLGETVAGAADGLACANRHRRKHEQPHRDQHDDEERARHVKPSLVGSCFVHPIRMRR